MKNNKIHYSITETIQSADGKSFTSFGIAGNNIFFDDVSADRTIVEEMIVRLNREQLEESQLMYFIEDELNRSII